MFIITEKITTKLPIDKQVLVASSRAFFIATPKLGLSFICVAATEELLYIVYLLVFLVGNINPITIQDKALEIRRI